ncbi:MAG: type II secretion system protein [Opitutaceae bacterium]
MKTPDRNSSYPVRGFSLIELIGVLAIITILAGTIAPNALRSIERAAVRAEARSLENLGEQLKLYLRDQAALPTSSNWTTALAAYSDLSPTDLAVNRRNNARVFLLDPARSPAERVIILSSMRSGLSLPTSGSINSAARFQDLWDTPENSIPSSVSWGGWNAWRNTPNSEDYLVIERVNLLPVYRSEFRTFTITLNNNGSTTSSYQLFPGSGGSPSTVNVPAGATAILTNLRTRDRVNLYRSSGAANLDYSYVVSDQGKTLDFDGFQWLPQ